LALSLIAFRWALLAEDRKVSDPTSS